MPLTPTLFLRFGGPRSCCPLSGVFRTSGLCACCHPMDSVVQGALSRLCARRAICILLGGVPGGNALRRPAMRSHCCVGPLHAASTFSSSCIQSSSAVGPSSWPRSYPTGTSPCWGPAHSRASWPHRGKEQPSAPPQSSPAGAAPSSALVFRLLVARLTRLLVRT